MQIALGAKGSPCGPPGTPGPAGASLRAPAAPSATRDTTRGRGGAGAPARARFTGCGSGAGAEHTDGQTEKQHGRTGGLGTSGDRRTDTRPAAPGPLPAPKPMTRNFLLPFFFF